MGHLRSRSLEIVGPDLTQLHYKSLFLITHCKIQLVPFESHYDSPHHNNSRLIFIICAEGTSSSFDHDDIISDNSRSQY